MSGEAPCTAAPMIVAKMPTISPSAMPSAANRTVRSTVRPSIMMMRTGQLGREADVTASVAVMATGYIKRRFDVSELAECMASRLRFAEYMLIAVKHADAQNGGGETAELNQRP